MDDTTWLVRFHNLKIFYLHINLMSFKKSAATDLEFLTRQEIALMKQARFKHMAKEHKVILQKVLFPLTVRLPIQNPISVRSIVCRLKPFHPWLDENSLQKYVQDFRKKLSFNNGNNSLNTASTNFAAITNNGNKITISKT